MNPVDAEKKVLVEVDRWVRSLLRKEKLQPHEQALFIAAIEWRHQLEAVYPMPANSKVPEVFPNPSISGMRPMTIIPSRDFDQVSTIPIPSQKQTALIREAKIPTPPSKRPKVS